MQHYWHNILKKQQDIALVKDDCLAQVCMKKELQNSARMHSVFMSPQTTKHSAASCQNATPFPTCSHASTGNERKDSM